jgi:hypothetical protein
METVPEMLDRNSYVSVADHHRSLHCIQKNVLIKFGVQWNHLGWSAMSIWNEFLMFRRPSASIIREWLYHYMEISFYLCYICCVNCNARISSSYPFSLGALPLTGDFLCNRHGCSALRFQLWYAICWLFVMWLVSLCKISIVSLGTQTSISGIVVTLEKWLRKHEKH